MTDTYEKYFNIDPTYYAAVTAELIKEGKVSWKKFYPHATFVKLLETTRRVLSGGAHRSIWVEGAYGTGKSHAALTVKSILEASDQEVRDYFDDFGLSSDLRDKFISLKNSGTILTVHRIGSASIHTEMDLVMAVQQSIMAALKEKGLTNHGALSMKDAFLKWAEDAANKAFFDAKIHDIKYIIDFSQMSADEVIEKLKNGDAEETEDLMAKVLQVLKDNGFAGLLTNANQMSAWIKDIIASNHLSSILFIWDEFSEYFISHPVGLTDFQTLAEISESQPFYFMVVAHESRNLFADANVAKKILDRFESPVKIELPENMAFKLMAQAMRVTSDSALKAEWASDKADLNLELGAVRRHIIESSQRSNRAGQKMNLTDEELQAITPMHPYAALLLKHIATLFNSNQRSMFDFIISNDMTDAKGFKWFIHNFGSTTEPNLLTIDLLWDFFCGQQKAGLNDDVRGILDTYNTMQLDKLVDNEKKVVKTILLFQAISLHIVDNPLLVPNDENLDMAFSGTEWAPGQAVNIAKGLVEKGLIFQKPTGSGKLEYCVANAGSGTSMGPFIDIATKETKTSALITNGKLLETIAIPVAIRGRFLLNDNGTGDESFGRIATRLQNLRASNRFKTMATFAIDSIEMLKIEQKIRERTKIMDDSWVIIEALTPMGADLKKQYIDNRAFSLYNARKNKAQAEHYEKQAMAVLSDWSNKIMQGAFMVYTKAAPNGERMANLEALQHFLTELDHEVYFYGVEQYDLTDTMYSQYALAQGALCGIHEKLSGAYKSSNKKSFEVALKGAWEVPDYWKRPELTSLPIVQIKKKVEDLIEKGFASKAGRVSVSDIWNELEQPPFGFMPCSAAALVMGFVLKEYANIEYFWSNGSLTKPMSPDTMKTMIAEAMTAGNDRKKKEQYIVTMTPEVKKFLQVTAASFHISEDRCNSVEDAATSIRIRMKQFEFPLWTVKSLLSQEVLLSEKELLSDLLDGYSTIANGSQEEASKVAEAIGKAALDHPSVADDLQLLCQSDKTRQGMFAYVASYQDGLLPRLAQEIADGGKYLMRIKSGFDAGEANWVWRKETADKVISNVILEYQIVAESSRCIGRYHSYSEAVAGWVTKAQQIKLPYEIVRPMVGSLGDFLKELKQLLETRTIQDKAAFYQLLCQEGNDFIAFYQSQQRYFIDAVSSFTEGMDEDSKKKLYLELPAGQLGADSTRYYNLVQERVGRYQQDKEKKELQEEWRQMTGSTDPKDWSYKNRTPILCLFTNEERGSAERLLPVIGDPNASLELVQKAAEYLKSLRNSDFSRRMDDTSCLDDCFMKYIVDQESILLKDPSEIRQKLFEYDCNVYGWWNNPNIRSRLKKMFKKEYELHGKAEAEQIFEHMSADQLREYLRDKLMDPDFGREILKGQR